MSRRLASLAAVLAMVWLPTCLVFVDETELVIVERLGQIVAVYDRPEDRGLQVKLPWPISLTRRFDRRIQLLSTPSREVFTRDRKNLMVEVYVCWQIPSGDEASPLDQRPVVQFFRRLGQSTTAATRLESRLQSIVATRLGQKSLTDLLAADQAEAAPNNQAASPLAQLASEIRTDLTHRADETASWTADVGVEIVDVGIRRLNLPAGNQQAVFERMRSERQKIAERYRSAGQAESLVIRTQAERQAGELLARAKADAERIRAGGEAEALRILNDAYRNDPEFAQRLQMLDAYSRVLTERTMLVLSAGSPLWRLLTEGAGLVPQIDATMHDPTPSALRPANASVPAARDQP